MYINTLITMCAIFYIAILNIPFLNNQVEGKKIKSQSFAKCQLDECHLKQQHFSLYSFVKRYVDNEFDLSGREIVPFLKSVDVLKRRFNNQNESQATKLNGTGLVQALLSNENLVSALKIFQSDDGRALINLYRASVNGKSQNLACSQSRIEDFELATSKFEANKLLASVFTNIHKNYLKKSAKKCLKHSCTSVETSMIKLDSVLGKYQTLIVDDNQLIRSSGDINNDQLQDNNNTFGGGSQKREFESEELELCKFFRKTNESDCEISGRELSEISFINYNNSKTDERTNKTTSSELLKDYLKSYYKNSKRVDKSGARVVVDSTLLKDTGESQEQTEKESLDAAARSIMAQCRPISSLLDYNLVAIKWYRKQNLIDEQKLNSRTFWCPSLSYWLQIDRLCKELESYLVENQNGSGETFSYEVGLNKHD